MYGQWNCNNSQNGYNRMALVGKKLLYRVRCCHTISCAWRWLPLLVHHGNLLFSNRSEQLKKHDEKTSLRAWSFASGLCMLP
jgi:hypothetical protein